VPSQLINSKNNANTVTGFITVVLQESYEEMQDVFLPFKFFKYIAAAQQAKKNFRGVSPSYRKGPGFTLILRHRSPAAMASPG